MASEARERELKAPGRGPAKSHLKSGPAKTIRRGDVPKRELKGARTIDCVKRNSLSRGTEGINPRRHSHERQSSQEGEDRSLQPKTKLKSGVRSGKQRK